jgi:alcohol dehydrogenase class IV
MNFEFATATRILFGAGKSKDIGPLASSFGRRPLLVTGLPELQTSQILALLAAQHLSYAVWRVEHEPTIALVDQGVALARQHHCDLVIGVGGGSALDTGKAIAAMLANPGDLLDYLEVVGRGQALTQPSQPYIAIPTTAGTGAEVTRNAVIGSVEHRVKVSLRSPLMLPRLALVDPELTYSLPPQVTASTGLDALTQLIEPYTCNAPNPMVDAFCREGLTRAARALQRAYEDGADTAARQDMSLASLFGGLTLANARLGAVHGFAGPLGGLFPAPHGAICARLLPFVMQANLQALRQRAPDNAARLRYNEIAQILTGSRRASAIDGIAWVEALCTALNIPPLSTYGMTAAHLPEVVEKSTRASSMKGNPIQLTAAELQHILEQAM